MLLLLVVLAALTATWLRRTTVIREEVDIIDTEGVPDSVRRLYADGHWEVEPRVR